MNSRVDHYAILGVYYLGVGVSQACLPVAPYSKSGELEYAVQRLQSIIDGMGYSIL